MRPVNKWTEDELLQKHRTLEAQVFELTRRPYLTASEQQQLTELKKRKLQAKDELLRRAS